MSLARQHFLRAKASLAMSAALVAGGAPASAADGPQAGDYELMYLRLRTDLARLKDIRSVEKKVELKRELLPEYAGWVQGRLDAAEAGGQGVQDEVLVTVMLWRIDVGDFEGALPLAAYALRFKLAMPERFKRGLACVLVEEVATAALKLLSAGQPAPYQVLSQVHDLTQHQDMPDEARAKLFKAVGLEHGRLAEDEAACAAAGVPNAQRAWRESAVRFLRRAIDLDASCGAKGDLKRVEKLLGREDAQQQNTAQASA